MALSQMTIDDLPESIDTSIAHFKFDDKVNQQSFTVDYFSRAQHRYERSLVRHERNKITVESALQGGLTNLSESWIETSGGDNSVTILASIYFKHIFTKNLFSIETQMNSKFGYYHVVLDEELDSGAVVRNPVWYKNQDEFWLSVTPSYKITDLWSYGATVKFRSQFAKGYVSSSKQEDYHLKSDFMAPGYLDVSGGVIYTSPKEQFPIVVSISPLALSATYVKNQEVQKNAQYTYLEHTEANDDGYVETYGVSPYSTSKYEGGSSIQIEFSKGYGKNEFFKYTTTLYTFYGWMAQLTSKNIYSDIHAYEDALEEWEDDSDSYQPILTIHPTVRWENQVTIKATELIATTLNFQLYYNRAQNLKVQSQTLLSVGLSYTFNR